MLTPPPGAVSRKFLSHAQFFGACGKAQNGSRLLFWVNTLVATRVELRHVPPWTQRYLAFRFVRLGDLSRWLKASDGWEKGHPIF